MRCGNDATRLTSSGVYELGMTVGSVRRLYGKAGGTKEGTSGADLPALIRSDQSFGCCAGQR